MSWLYKRFVRPVLFDFDSEEIHNRTLQALSWISRSRFCCEALGSFFSAPRLPVTAFGLNFPNPVGLAAGMDKEAVALPAWEHLGFGFAELGGVTSQAQPGNPLPRIFRIIPEEALINRMGFNNPGAAAIAERMAEWQRHWLIPDHPIGFNLGKSKVTPLAEAAEDYRQSFRLLWPYGNFFVLNVSSPNTPNLRQLQDKAALADILRAVNSENRSASAAAKPPLPLKPVLVKIAPDLSWGAIDELIELALERQLAGIVATNTTVGRPPQPPAALARLYAETGGLSGRPLQTRSTEIVRYVYRQTKGRLTVIGVGGIFSAADAWEKICAGASLIQLYTSLIYEGPAIARAIVTGLAQLLSLAGLNSVSEAIGSELPLPER